MRGRETERGVKGKGKDGVRNEGADGSSSRVEDQHPSISLTSKLQGRKITLGGVWKDW